MPRPGVCCVIGAGDATGSAVARRFAKEGYTVCVARRTATALKPLVDQITVEGGKADSQVYPVNASWFGKTGE